MKYIARKDTNGVYQLFQVLGTIFSTKEVFIETLHLSKTKDDVIEYIRKYSNKKILELFEIRSHYDHNSECFTAFKKNILGIMSNVTSDFDGYAFYRHKELLVNEILKSYNKHLKIEIIE